MDRFMVLTDEFGDRVLFHKRCVIVCMRQVDRQGLRLTSIYFHGHTVLVQESPEQIVSMMEVLPAGTPSL